MKPDNRHAQLNRRRLLKAVSLAGAGFWTGAGSVVACSKGANEKLNIACIGVGNRGAANVRSVSAENIVALCDVDERLAGRVWETLPRAKRYEDFRVMFDEMERGIDAVVVSTPDHTHASVSLMALHMGKHVYCEKPLAHNVYECRLVTRTARTMNVMTQLGNQLHASFQVHRARELIEAGMIGKVKEVHCAEGMRPGDVVFPRSWGAAVTGESGRPRETPPVPRGLAWDLWLGPALERPYHPTYCPGGWRFWRDFGTGRFGDVACHIMDPAFLALDLKYPVSVKAVGPPVPYERLPGPGAIAVRYEFPARGDHPPLSLYWHGAGSGPPAELLDGHIGTCLFVGEHGQLLCNHDPRDADREPLLLPRAKFRDIQRPDTRVAHLRSRAGFRDQFERLHHQQWLDACRTGTPPGCHFPTYGGPLSETPLLGQIAFQSGQKLSWDGERMEFPAHPEAEKYLRRAYRRGWEL